MNKPFPEVPERPPSFPDLPTSDKPMLKLVGSDGNAFALLGKAKRAANNAGWSEAKWKEIQKEAMSGDYDHLLQTLIAHFEVC